MKFLYCSDLHGKSKNPRSRLDNYAESWLKKIDNMVQLSIDYNCQHVIVNGDVFDTPHISNILLDEFVDRIEKSHKIDKKIIWKIVPGNHDLLGANWELSQASALAHIFRRSSLIDRLTVIETEDYYIQGIDFYYGIEDNIKENGLFTKSNAKFKVCIPHAFISIKPFFKEVSHVLAKDLKTNFNMVLCGHFHSEFDDEIDNVRFINLNSIGRTSINEQHCPTVAIIDTNTGKIEKKQLIMAKRMDEIFDLSKYSETKDNEKSIEDFIASLNSATWQMNDLNSQIEVIGKEQKIEKNIIDYLKTKITKLKLIEND
jgi:DNA repair exonuclease SbcCD nuclease subunit